MNTDFSRVRLFRNRLCFTLSIVAPLISAGTIPLTAIAQGSIVSATGQLPHFITAKGRHALIVDGAPFVVLSGEAHNSSNAASALPKVWPAIRQMNANTLAMPIGWEQIEPQEGHFDFSFVDTLLAQARLNKVRLNLLWFGFMKNTGPSYTPVWVKDDNGRFPRQIMANGQRSHALSPHSRATLEADLRAFRALMRHLKQVDPQRTVIMMQIENEVGVWGNDRDHTPAVDTLFADHVPRSIVKALGKAPGTWTQVFGKEAASYFTGYFIARFVDQVAAAGKAEYPLPMYVNAITGFASGAPTPELLNLWRFAAPTIDFIGPDIYERDHEKMTAFLDSYRRPNNALFVAETGNHATAARYLFDVLGRRGIGFQPFGTDFTGYSNYPLGAETFDTSVVKPFAANYALVGAMNRFWAKAAFEGEVWGVGEPEDHSSQTLDLGGWKASINYRLWEFGQPEWNKDKPRRAGSDIPSGGALIARFGPDDYLVTARNARVSIDVDGAAKAKGSKFQFLAVEEGHFDGDRWIVDRVWNGDQTDYGLNFRTENQLLRVRLGHY